MGLAWSFGWKITAALLAGYYADDGLGTTPLLTLVFSIAALVVGVRQLLETLSKD